MNNGHSPPKTADIVNFGSWRDGRIDSISPRAAQAGEHHRPGQGSCGHGASVCPAPVLPTFG
jgi:hypothetical protein